MIHLFLCVGKIQHFVTRLLRHAFWRRRFAAVCLTRQDGDLHYNSADGTDAFSYHVGMRYLAGVRLCGGLRRLTLSIS